jgi:hypothetical protein
MFVLIVLMFIVQEGTVIVDLYEHIAIAIWFMGWLSRIFKGSGHKVSEGHYYKDDSSYYLPSTSGVIG